MPASFLLMSNSRTATPCLLQVRNLRTYFRTRAGLARAVDGVSFTVDRGETVGLVGESGCGKSVTALSIMQLVPEPAGFVAGGEILLGGENIVEYSFRQKQDLRGDRIAMVFQDPMTSLNPVFTIGSQIVETIRRHQGTCRREAWACAAGLLARVGIPQPERRLKEYPHQLSGGMQQRVMIALALSCRPDLLLADEPTTALDVTIQAQILDLIAELQQELNMAVLLITHDLGVVAGAARRVCVMYAGKIVETGRTEDLFSAPRHPYTQALLESLPSRTRRGQPLRAIPGTVPPATGFPPGCRFCDRCSRARERCRHDEPPLTELAPEHQVACWLVTGGAEQTDQRAATPSPEKLRPDA